MLNVLDENLPSLILTIICPWVARWSFITDINITSNSCSLPVRPADNRSWSQSFCFGPGVGVMFWGLWSHYSSIVIPGNYKFPKSQTDRFRPSTGVLRQSVGSPTIRRRICPDFETACFRSIMVGVFLHWVFDGPDDDLDLDNRQPISFVECEIIISIFQVYQLKCQDGAHERIERCS